MAVVVGYDESPGADAALATAISVAQRFGEVLVLVYGAGPPGGLGEESGAHRDALREIGAPRSRTPSTAPRPPASTPRSSSSTPSPPRRCSRSASKHDASVLVVGTAGESPLKGAMLGSTPHKLLHLSTRPVLCVPFAE